MERHKGKWSIAAGLEQTQIFPVFHKLEFWKNLFYLAFWGNLFGYLRLCLVQGDVWPFWLFMSHLWRQRIMCLAITDTSSDDIRDAKLFPFYLLIYLLINGGVWARYWLSCLAFVSRAKWLLFTSWWNSLTASLRHKREPLWSGAKKGCLK